MKKATQEQQVIEALRKVGGYATLRRLIFTPPYNHLEIKTLQIGAPNGVPVPFQASYASAA